jgi:hypothetical protein
MNQVYIESARFNKQIRVNDGGSIFLGYITLEAVVNGTFECSGQEVTGQFKIGMPGIQVRISQKGKARIEFPSKPVVAGEKRYDAYWAANAFTRDALTRLVFDLPEVATAFHEGVEAGALNDQEHLADTGTDGANAGPPPHADDDIPF